ncbi:MAG: peroxiredoxin [Bacteroidetes bacterium]|nr:peroxiredoxin [Bacteroidota bacterium]
MKSKIKVGDTAPMFTLPGSDGQLVNLADFIGKKNLVVYFYPKDESYGCTKEACSFRDSYDDFKDAGAEVIGISTDDEESHRSFAEHHKLPFILLSDKGGKAAESYGVGRSLGILPGRMTFVVDKNGIVRMTYSSQLNFQNHINEAIEMLKTL